MPRDLIDDESALVQVMAWCRLATSHYLNQCGLISMTPHGITKPQWVNQLTILVLKLEYFGWTRLLQWQLMPWLLASPGHQQPWYWLYRIGQGHCPPWGKISAAASTQRGKMIEMETHVHICFGSALVQVMACCLTAPSHYFSLCWPIRPIDI